MDLLNGITTINNISRQKLTGNKYIQQRDMNWSYRYLGKVALIHTVINI